MFQSRRIWSAIPSTTAARKPSAGTEFRAPRNNPTALSLYQGGTYAPDATYRWMGSIAMDKMGNIALGYSRSSATLHPDIYFTGRLRSRCPGDDGR